MAGWAYWEYKPFHDITTSAGNRSEGFYNRDGSLQTKKVKALSRTYVQAAQGTVQSMDFYQANETSAFAADIKIDMSIKEPTEIHVSVEGDPATVWYPNGLLPTAVAADASSPQPVTNIKFKDGEPNTLTIMVTNQEFDGHVMKVKIVPK